MSYLMRVNVRPDPDSLTVHERSRLQSLFDTYAAEVRIHGEPVGWNEITEVELVKAPTVGGLSSWLLGLFVNTTDRYHLGVYLGRDEAVLANITEEQARYALHAIAYYAPKPVRYRGPDGFVPLTEV
jgi:hypothetical protein